MGESMVVIHIINGKIYAMKYCMQGSKMERVTLDEAIKLMTAEATA